MDTQDARSIAYLVGMSEVYVDKIRKLLAGKSITVLTCSGVDQMISDDLKSLRCCIVLKFIKNETSKTISRLIENNSKIPIIVLSDSITVRSAVEMMKSGVADLVEEPLEAAPLAEVIHENSKVAEATLIAASARHDAQQRVARLSTREKQVVDLLVDGLTNREIATTLSLSAGTVEEYRARSMAKVGAESLAQIIRFVLLAR